VSLDIDVECLRLNGGVGGVVDAWLRARRTQVMQIASQLSKLGPRILLLPVMLITHSVLMMLFQLLAHLFVLGLHMREVILPSVEVVLVLA
jgi:hypothetical protein